MRCYIDFETTGIDREKDRIVQFAFVKGGEILHSLVNPGIPIPAGATEVHHITDEMVANSPSFDPWAEKILAFIDGCSLVGYNCLNFDIPMLYNEFLRAGRVWNWQAHDIIDACNIMKINEARTLEAAFKFYTGETMTLAHDSSKDALATAVVLKAQLERYPHLPVMTESELALYSNYGRKMLDINARFIESADGDVLLNFGKHKGEKAAAHLDYLSWMTTKDFPPDAIAICHRVMEGAQAR